MVTAANERYWLDGRCKGEAEGYQYNTDGTERIIPDDNPDPAKRNPRGIFDRNGGLVAMRRVNLSDDNLMFRFAAKKYLGAGPDALLPLLNSPWWMEEDRMVLLLSRARSGFGTRLVDAARTQLALPQEWSDADILVSVRIRRGIVLAAHAGPGRTVDVAGGRFTIPRGEAPHLFIDQLYIPGLGSPGGSRAAGVANASAWFDTATARSFDPNARGFNP